MMQHWQTIWPNDFFSTTYFLDIQGVTLLNCSFQKIALDTSRIGSAETLSVVFATPHLHASVSQASVILSNGSNFLCSFMQHRLVLTSGNVIHSCLIQFII